MSIGSTDIACSLCGFETSSTRAHGNFYYECEGVYIPVERELGWCNTCCNLEAVELNVEACEIENEFPILSRAVAQIAEAGIFKVRKRRRLANDLSARIADLSAWTRIYYKRTRLMRCLKCGNSDHFHLDLDSSIAEQPPLQHPGCGGSFFLADSEFRFSFVFPYKIYSIDGFKLREEDVALRRIAVTPHYILSKAIHSLARD